MNKRIAAWTFTNLAFATVCGTAGCMRGPEVKAPTVEYFRAHAAERQAQLRECTSDPGSLNQTNQCVNAREAERAEGVGSLRDLPSMGLSAADDSPSEK
jgi:hypothetical protein